MSADRYAAALLAAGLFLTAASPARAARAETSVLDADTRSPYLRGIRLYADGNLREALEQFRLAVKQEPGNQYIRNAVSRVEQELATGTGVHPALQAAAGPPMGTEPFGTFDVLFGLGVTLGVAGWFWSVSRREA